MSETFLDLYNKFLVFVDQNDEEGARNFLIENLDKFPEEVKNSLIFAFFEESLSKEGQDIKNLTKFQEQAIDAISQVDKAKKILEDKIKVLNIKDQLNTKF
jgi:hypothetical protein